MNERKGLPWLITGKVLSPTSLKIVKSMREAVAG